MSTMQSTPMFDVETLRRGIEGRDASAMRDLYAENAHMTLVDRRDQPSHPHELTGSAAIGEFLDELCSRDMEHRLEQVVVSADGTHAAYLEKCSYPDGTRVMATSMLDLRDGRIVAQTSLQAWDEETARSATGTEGATGTAAGTASTTDTTDGTPGMNEAKMRQMTEHLDFDKPDEVRRFGHGRAEILNVAGGTVGRLVLEPGWRWSQDVKPLAGTELCEAPHFQYHISGRIRIRMADGTEFDAKAGDITVLPSGHDAWVIGDEPVVVVDWQGAVHYGEKAGG